MRVLMSIDPAYLLALPVLLACMAALWLLSLALRDASIVDIFWGVGFLVAAVVYAPNTAGDTLRRAAVLGMTALWSLRLSGYLAWRNHGRGEDKRYVAMRAAGGAGWWWRSLFQVFALQGMILWIVSAPIHGALSGAHAFGALDVAGMLLWLFGFLFEVIGDGQLARFKADPANRGKVLRSGLWARTRHPNYFGEAVLGWGVYLLALSAGAWWTVFAPLLMTFLLVRVSGVALLEKTLAAEKPAYAAYVREVPAFFPFGR
jgi:steroid 5-alpha reductase family enzyme